MISFNLKCTSGHVFEGWFRSSSDYERQHTQHLIACPHCGDGTIEKALSAPNIGRKGNQLAPVTRTQTTDATDAIDTTYIPDTATVTNMPEIPPQMQQALQELAKMQANMLKKSEWVGPQFANEARAIHYGEKADRLIHGEATISDAEELADEGIAISPLLFQSVPDNAKN